MQKYEGLFILDTAGKDDAVKAALDRIQAEIKTVGGKVESVQKMDYKPFARPSRKHAGGFYANIVFQSPRASLDKLRAHFKLDEQIHRVLITHAAPAAVPGKERRGQPE